MRRLGRYLAPATAAVLALTLVGCGGPATGTGAAGPAATGKFYVSIGDSYAAGYRPVAGGAGSTTTDGFAYQLADYAGKNGDPVRLENFGCSGSTSGQLRTSPGCVPAALGPGAPDYQGRTQLDAATAFLAGHRGQIALITVVIGGDDLKPCLVNDSGAERPDAAACASAAVAELRTNLTEILAQIRSATGPGVPIVGLTYPDVFLGAWLSPADGMRTLATDSVTLFHDLLNPALKAVYTQAGATFADITAAAGGYGSLDQLVSDPTYGSIPAPVERICTLTYYCRLGDVHPTVAGNQLIAQQVVDAVYPS